MNTKSIKDIWNSFMLGNANFDKEDIPYCKTNDIEIPKEIINWKEAKHIYKINIQKNKKFIHDAYVCFYIDDYLFDGKNGIWFNYDNTLKVLKHFSGAITPDFSTYQDFPFPLKFYNTYRMRVFGYWLNSNGINTINNVRWGTEETYSYCFNGIPKNSIICIGTVGGSPRKLEDRERFEKGFAILLKKLKPKIILIYGSSNYKCFKKVDSKIQIIQYDSHTNKSFKRRKNNV